MNKSAATAPTWVTEWYPNDAYGQAYAITRYHMPVTDTGERRAAAAFVLGETFPCLGCGKFAFQNSKLCYWCNRGTDGTTR